MKITIETKELKNKLAQLSGVVENKAAIPVLSCVKLASPATIEGQYTLTAHDLATAKSVPLVVKEAGDFDFFDAVLLPVKLRQVLTKLSTENVSLEFEGTKVSVQAGAFQADIETLPVEQFPATPENPADERELDLKQLQTLIKRTKFAVPETAGKFVIAASLLQSDGKKLSAVGTDGIRLAYAKVDGDFGKFEMVLPLTAQVLLEGMTGEKVRVSETEASLFFWNNTARIYVRKTPAKFPDLTQILNTKAASSIKFSAGSLRDAIGRASQIADAEKPVSKFIHKDGVLLIETKSINGTSTEKVAVSGDGKEFTFVLNLDHLGGFIDKVEGEIVFSSQGKGSATVFTSGPDSTYLLMPFVV